MKALKLLISLIFFQGIAVAEPIMPDGEIDNVLVTFHWFDTLSDLEFHFGEERLEGMSYCERDLEKRIAWCDVYVVRPQEVDGPHTLTVGHEVLHGVYGPDYHEVVE